MANGIASLAPQQPPMMGAAPPPPQMPPQADPTMEAETSLSQIASSGASKEELEAGVMASLQEADPQLVEEIMASLQGVTLPMEEKEEFLDVIMSMLKSPEEYPELLKEAYEAEYPVDMFPTEYDVGHLSAIYFVVSQIPTDDGGQEVQTFRDGGLVSLKPIAKFLQAQGREGDTILAHINPQEAALLKSLGGAGSINPVTGLREYKLKKLLKKAGKAIKSVASSIGNAVEKVVKSDIGKVVLAAGAVLLAAPTGGASLAAAGGMLKTVGAGLAAVATSPAGISALTTTGIQLARGKDLGDALKDGLKVGLTVGAGVGVSSAIGGGSITAGFGLGTGAAQITTVGEALTAAKNSVGTIVNTIKEPFSVGENAKTGEKTLEIFGLPANEVGKVATGVAAVGSSVAAYKDAKDQQEENRALAAEQKEMFKPRTGAAFTVGGVSEQPTEDSESVPGAPSPGAPSPGTSPGFTVGSGQPGMGFSPPPTQGFNSDQFSFLNQQPQPDQNVGQPYSPFSFQSPFAVPQPGGGSLQDFLAMYQAPQSSEGIAGFAQGGYVNGNASIARLRTGGVASEAVLRAKRNAAINAAAFPTGNKPQLYVNAAGRQISKAEWEANQARMQAENLAMRQRDTSFLSNQAEAKRIAEFNKMMAQKETQRRQEVAQQAAAERAQQAAAAKAAQEAAAQREAARVAAQQRAAQEAAQQRAAQEAAQQRAAQEAAQQRAAQEAAQQRAAQEAAQQRAAQEAAQRAAQEAAAQRAAQEAAAQRAAQEAAAQPQAPAGGIATLPESPGAINQGGTTRAPTVPSQGIPEEYSALPLPMPASPGSDFVMPPTGQVPVSNIDIPSAPQIPPTSIDSGVQPAPQIPSTFTNQIYQPIDFGVQPPTQIPPTPINQFYQPIDFGNAGAVGFGSTPTFNSGAVPTFFNQGGIAAVSPARFSKGTPPKFYPRKVGAINGPGTGTSDSIPAMLSDGEFVFTAKAVRAAGGGSRIEGAKKMYQMMKALERKAQRG